MLECKRKFERFNLPLAVSFRPTYGATEYTVGLMKNISGSGLAIEAEDFSFIKYENLELNVQIPPGTEAFYLSGSVMWKKQNDDKCMAGVKLKSMAEEVHNRFFENISSFGNIPLDRLQPNSQSDYVVKAFNGEHAPHQESKKKKRSQKKIKRTGFTKQYFSGGSKCKVTFRLPIEAAANAQKVAIVGDFNNWNTSSILMKQVTRGDYLVTIELQSNREYRFKYLIDDSTWENDWCADKYRPNDFGSDDSVVIV